MPEESLNIVPESEKVEVLSNETGAERELSSQVESEVPPERLEAKGERYAQLLSRVQQASTDDDEVEADAQTVGTLEEAEKRIHTLVEMAQIKGVAHAVRVAKRMNDLYVLDTMHDELADELYEGLLAKGLITKE
jgi:hypothetical protein